MEIWKDVIGYEGLYQVSNLGNIRTLERQYYSGRNHSICKTQKSTLLKQQKDKDGYLTVGLSKDGVQKYTRVHRVVAEAFIFNDDPENKTQVNHKDEIKSNNKVDNLEWCTAKYNMNYGTRLTRISEKTKGIANKGCLKSKEIISKEIICVTTNKIFKSIKDAADFYKVDNSSITAVCKGKRNYCGTSDDGKHLVFRYLENGNVIEPEMKCKSADTPNRTKKVVCTTTNKVFNSIKEAADFYKISATHIPAVCNGKRNFCGKLSDGTKLQWKYLDDTEVTE